MRRVFVKIAYYFVKGVSAFGRVLSKSSKQFLRPFSFVTRKFGRYVLLPLYKGHVYIKRRLFSVYSPARSKVFLVLTKKYIVHVLIISLTLFVFVGNLNAQEIRDDDFGNKTIMSRLFRKSANFELVEETAVYQPQGMVFSYLDQSGQVENKKLAKDSASVTEEQLAEGLTAVTGDGAVLKPNITETDITTGARKNAVNHIVKEGETLSVIAEQYGISLNTILWANNLTSRSTIKPGMTLRILPVSGVEHKVKSGDTLGSIANKYDIKKETIIDANDLDDNGTITIGETLLLPGGTVTAPVVSRSSYTAPSTSSSGSSNSVSSSPPSGSNKPVPTNGKWVWPTDLHVITQYYGWRHTGVDIDCYFTNNNYAAAAGTVIYAGWRNGYGNTVEIDHGGGVMTRYGHHKTLYVKTGQHVEAGQAIGMCGTTGHSTGTHLHFEVKVNGSFRNPLGYIR